jgi:hypothetical protein
MRATLELIATVASLSGRRSRAAVRRAEFHSSYVRVCPNLTDEVLFVR